MLAGNSSIAQASLIFSLGILIVAIEILCVWLAFSVKNLCAGAALIVGGVFIPLPVAYLLVWWIFG